MLRQQRPAHGEDPANTRNTPSPGPAPAAWRGRPPPRDRLAADEKGSRSRGSSGSSISTSASSRNRYGRCCRSSPQYRRIRDISARTVTVREGSPNRSSARAAAPRPDRCTASRYSNSACRGLSSRDQEPAAPDTVSAACPGRARSSTIRAGAPAGLLGHPQQPAPGQRLHRARAQPRQPPAARRQRLGQRHPPHVRHPGHRRRPAVPVHHQRPPRQPGQHRRRHRPQPLQRVPVQLPQPRLGELGHRVHPGEGRRMHGLQRAADIHHTDQCGRPADR